MSNVFLGFANFNQHFITCYSSIVASLIRLTRKDQPFSWEVEANNAFQLLKVYLMTPPFLIHVDLSKPFVLETNVFDFVIGTVLSQLGEHKFFHPIGFCFHMFSLAKINYKIHDKV
jgi:hypothetical protein